MQPDNMTQPPGERAEREPDPGFGETVDVPEGQEVAAPPPDRPPRPASVGRLRRERRRLWDERQEVVYHVGGLATDLHARGIDDPSLVWHRIAVVHELDARIAAIDAQLADPDTGRRVLRRGRPPKPEGYCLSCGEPYLPDAVFCSQCGSRIPVASAPDGDAPGPEHETEVLSDADTQAIRTHPEGGS